jgi:hypothetical protein
MKPVQTVQYVEVRQDLDDEGNVYKEEARQWMILGAKHRRHEAWLKHGPCPDDSLRHCVVIEDWDAKKLILLYPERQEYEYPQPESQVGISTDCEPKSESKPVPKREVDLYREVRDLPLDQAHPLPDRILDGQRLLGLETILVDRADDGVITMTRQFWVDPDTKLPVRIESSHRTTRPDHGETDWLEDQFVFDAPLDESLFSADPPAGFRQRKYDADGNLLP